MQQSFHVTQIPAVPLILLAVVLLGIPLLIRLFNRNGSDSVLRAMGLTVAICVGLVFLVRFARMAEHQESAAIVSDSQLNDVAGNVDLISEIDGELSPPHPSASLHPIPLELEAEKSETVGNEVLQSAATSSNEATTMWLPLSSDAIGELLSPEAAEAVDKLNETLPPELRQAYAVIPLASATPNLKPPVLDTALSVPAVRDALASASVQTAVANFLELALLNPNADSDASDGAEIVAAEYIPATWRDNPGVGQVVVESEFVESGVPAEDVLRPAIIKALKAHVSKRSRQKFSSDGDWQKLVDISVSDRALTECIVETNSLQEVVSINGTDHLMQKTYALVEFPEAMEDQVLANVHTALRQDRAIALCVAVGALWLGWMLLSVVFRASQQGTFLRKLATVPILSLFVLPCVLVAVLMTGAIVEGKTFSFTWSGERISCQIDAQEH